MKDFDRNMTAATRTAGLSRVLGMALGLVLALLITASATLVRAPVALADEGDDPEAGKPTIQVDLASSPGKIHKSAFGLIFSPLGNERPEPMYFYRTPEGRAELKELGVRSLAYIGDRNDWRAPFNQYTALPEQYPTTMLTDEFLALNQSLGSDPIIAVNVMTLCHPLDPNAPPSSSNVQCENATPKLAADWLSYIKSRGVKVKYVQLGGEPYAGCRYWKDPAGLNCVNGQYNQHKIVLTQEEYAKRVRQWAKALRKVDPTIKLGLHLQPNTEICRTNCAQTWDELLLKQVGSLVDFIIVHEYFMLGQRAAASPAEALKYSYYQAQRDVRVMKNGVTAMPIQMRTELSRWLPSKKTMPIVIGEFNAGMMNDKSTPPENLKGRMSLYAGFSLAEAALDMVSPVTLGGATLPGAERAILLDLASLPAMIVHAYGPPEAPDMVKAPAWYTYSAISVMQGKKWATATVNNNPKTAVGRPALRVYAVTKGKAVWLAVFNHSDVKAFTSSIILAGGSPKSATLTRIGAGASSFLDVNSDVNPTLIAPQGESVAVAQIKADRLAQMKFPPHTLTMIHVTLK